MYNYYQPQAQSFQQNQTLSYLKGRPVSSIDEARTSTIDFDGSIFYFPDLANNRIYTKQINLNGTASLNVYELKPSSPDLNTDFITRNEFNELVEKLQNILQQKNSSEKQEFNFK